VKHELIRLYKKLVVLARESVGTEKDINTLLSSVLEHIKIGWSARLNVALWGSIKDLSLSS